jgi:inhibitor of cysteine peptidase
MVQREVTKKTRIYGSAAVLSAIVLVSLIFVFGAAPGLTPLVNPPPVSGMKTFADESALRNYLVQNTEGVANVGGPLDSRFLAGTGGDSYWVSPAVPSTTNGFGSESATKDNSYSTTNIQVAGVDEADTVKTDGSYLYVSSDNWTTGQNYISIVKADPSDLQVIAKISLENNSYLAGMYLSQDSSKLIVVGSIYGNFLIAPQPMIAGRNGPITVYSNFLNSVETFLNVYDISDKVHPSLAENFTLSGSYFNSRMIGNYVYAVVSQPAYVLQNNDVPLPTVYTNSAASDIVPSKIYYSDTANYTDVANNYFTYTTFVGLNVQNSSQPLTNMTVLMAGAGTMYVSLNSIYVTYPTWNDGGEYTSIYRISVNEGNISSDIAKGVVGGSVLNQYSMDEYNGDFRLATTNWKETTQNAVYVLDQNLTTVGSLQLENTELRETIQSARFIGDKAYIVTYEQKDPFFVLDMSNPTSPQVAGKLEIPGYSSYLHPYDDNHIIGLGMENSTVKLSLFDVTNVNSPTEIAKYNVQADYSYSDALYEPKAFLFDKTKQLLVIPVTISNYGVIGGGVFTPGVPNTSGKSDGSTTSTPSMQGSYWQGAYVFKLTLNGFQLIGGATQQDYATSPYGENNLNVNRALYIGNTLYTVSNSEVQLNSLTDLSPIATVSLS